MAIQPIRLFGDPILRTEAEPVLDFDAELRRLVKDLSDTMMDAPGVGLAAPQIGVSLRVFTYFIDDELGHLINPDLELSGEEQYDIEGCLSLPGIEYDCRRARHVVAKGFNEYGDRSSSRATTCSPAASSTKRITSTACCSSTASTGRLARQR